MADMSADVVVVGLGAMGAAALYQLARRGVSAIGVDRFAPPHDLGSSHGETRITRQAIGEGAPYVPFVLKSHEIWRELEAETGERLLEACGALVMGPAGGKSSHHGKPDFVGRSTAAATEFGIRHEVFDADEVRRRFPQFAPTDDVTAYYEPDGGYVRPEAAIRVQLDLARRLGARVLGGEAVMAIRQSGDGVEMTTAVRTVRASKAIVTAGAWTGPLLGAPFDRLLGVKRQVLHWFEADDLPVSKEPSPVFIWMHGAGDSDYLYGFPPLPGDNRVKVATEQYEATTTADAVERTVTAGESAKMFENHVAGRLRGVNARVAKAAACVYTVTPDLGFIIDAHPEMDRVLVVSACSGHGFKHSAGLGHAVAEHSATGVSPIDLTPFSLARFG